MLGVSNIFGIFIWDRFSIWQHSYFLNGMVQAPTRFVFFSFLECSSQCGFAQTFWKSLHFSGIRSGTLSLFLNGAIPIGDGWISGNCRLWSWSQIYQDPWDLWLASKVNHYLMFSKIFFWKDHNDTPRFPQFYNYRYVWNTLKPLKICAQIFGCRGGGHVFIPRRGGRSLCWSHWSHRGKELWKSFVDWTQHGAIESSMVYLYPTNLALKNHLDKLGKYMPNT